MNDALASMESRLLFMEWAEKRMYEKETMIRLYAMIRRAQDKDAMCRALAELMQEYPREEDLLYKAEALFLKNCGRT